MLYVQCDDNGDPLHIRGIESIHVIACIDCMGTVIQVNIHLYIDSLLHVRSTSEV
jgi:hypothetical protein